jgi:ribonuclease-3
MAGLAELEEALGHVFDNPALAQEALTHSSAGKPNNERLEFLGDAVLGLMVAEAVSMAFPGQPEGVLSRLRAHVVNNGSLAAAAGRIGLQRHIRLGPGEGTVAGGVRPSIMAGALEALFGAVFADSSWTKVRVVISRVLRTELDALQTGQVDPQALKDPKSRLQEWLQRRGEALPVYRILNQQESCTVCCQVRDSLEFVGHGRNRKAAEQAAAEAALLMLERGR